MQERITIAELLAGEVSRAVFGNRGLIFSVLDNSGRPQLCLGSVLIEGGEVTRIYNVLRMRNYEIEGLVGATCAAKTAFEGGAA